jgi:hydroxypyruvate isomerase
MSFRLAVSAEMVFTDLPFLERVRRIDQLGYEVEIWDWTKKDIKALVETGATFSSMTGYITGTLADPDGAAELLRTAERSLQVAEELNCPRLNVHGTGLDDKGLPVIPTDVVSPEMWLTAARTLTSLASLGERAGRVFTLENLNTAVNHPRTPFAKAADTLALVEAVDNPHLRMNLDLYHAQIGEGNLIQLLERALPAVGEIQVADVPGRCEPGTGEINYPAIAAALVRLGYDGVVGLEAFASGDSLEALERFRNAFAVEAVVG